DGSPTHPVLTDNDYLHLLTVGKGLVENRHFAEALPYLQRAVELRSTDLDARLDLANAYLLLVKSDDAIREGDEALRLEPKSAEAYYIVGSANLRLRRFEPASKALQVSKQLDPSVAAVSFQLGRAHEGLGQWEAARAALQDAVNLEPRHPS